MDGDAITAICTPGRLGRPGVHFGSAALSPLALLATACLLLFSGTAHAAVTHQLDSSFTPAGISQPAALALDESAGFLYVLDKATGELGKFDAATGDPVNFSALGTNLADTGCADQCIQVAVDNSAGPNHGVLYVSTTYDSGPQVGARGFLPSGLPVDRITVATGETDPASFPAQGLPFCGVATDGAGQLYIAHPVYFPSEITYPRPNSGAWVDRFKPGPWLRAESSQEQSWPVTGVLVGMPESVVTHYIDTCRIASNSDGDIYYSRLEEDIGHQRYEPYPVVRADHAYFDFLPGPPLFRVDSASTAFASDFSNGDMYFDHEGGLARQDREGAVLEAFGGGLLSTSYGIAVDGSAGAVYASDAAVDKVFLFESVITPDLEKESASAARTTASLTALVGTAGASDVTDCFFEYGATTSYGSLAKCSPDASITPYSAPGATAVTASLSGLTEEATYHYRLLATNANGTTKGGDRTFTTHHVLDLSTDQPSGLTTTTAVLNGSFTGNGELTHYYFEWGPTAAYGNKTAAPPGDPAASAAGHIVLAAPISGLTPHGPASSPYHYRLVATNPHGTTYGADRSFLTAAPDPPQINATDASAITQATAHLSAQVNPRGATTSYLFEFGTDTSYGSATPLQSLGEDEADHSVAANLTGLASGTTYHYRTVALSFGGTAHSPDRTFTTPTLPTIQATASSAVGRTTAHLSAVVSPNASSTQVRFEYGTSSAYSQSILSQSLDGESLDGNFLAREATADLTGLAPGATYHFRALATNSVGTAVGPDATFSTQAEEARLPPPPPHCKKGYVKRHGKCVKRPKKRKGSAHRRGERG